MQWIAETKQVLEKFRLKTEPMCYVLPTTKGQDCAICGGYIKPRKEIIYEFDGYESYPMCGSDCWLVYGRRQLFKNY